MYAGWLMLGDSPFTVGGQSHEIINNARAYAYARDGGICWLQECEECPATEIVVPGAPFVSVKDDPAPWFDETNPDTLGFYGVIGLEVQGADDSTRHATVTEALVGGGAIGPTYYSPRTIVIRGLAVAAEECALQAGLDWLRFQCDVSMDPCRGDNFNFFDCCPCMCVGDEPGGPCWATTYRELRLGPLCTKPEGDPPRLMASVGQVYTDNPGDLPPEFTIAVRVRGPFNDLTDPSPQVLISQGTVASEPSWELGRYPATDPFFPGGLYFQWNDGSGPRLLNIGATPITEEWVDVAITINRDDGLGFSRITGWWSENKGLSWSKAEETVNIPIVDFAVTSEVIVGGRPPLDGLGGTGNDTFDIAVATFITGITPETADELWRFDGEDIPFPTAADEPYVWTDPRGRTWSTFQNEALHPQEAGQAGAWWPDTYLELRTGPPMPDDDWCDWPDIYVELKTGPAAWACCNDLCIVPYYRQFHNARIVSGPTILRHPVLNSNGALMEVEFTIVAADPSEYGLPGKVSGAPAPLTMGTAAAPDPGWTRETLDVPPDPRGRWLMTSVPTVRLAALDGPSGVVMLSMVDGTGTAVVGVTINPMPQGATVVVDLARRECTVNGTIDFCEGWYGPPRNFDISRNGPWVLTLDQEDTAMTPLTVEVISTPKAAV